MRVRPLKRRVSSMPGTKKISPTPGHDQIADRVGAIIPQPCPGSTVFRRRVPEQSPRPHLLAMRRSDGLHEAITRNGERSIKARQYLSNRVN